MKEIEQPSDVADFPVLDAFPFNHISCLISYHQVLVKKKYYGNNKGDIIENIKKDGALMIKCSKENFLVEARRYFGLVAEKNIRSKANTKEKLKIAKRMLLEMERNKITARNLKSQQREVDSLSENMKLPLSLNEAFLLVEVLPNIATLLQLIQVCPTSGIVAE